MPAKESLDLPTSSESTTSSHGHMLAETANTRRTGQRGKGRRLLRVAILLGSLALVAGATLGWLAYRAVEIRNEMTAVSSLAPQFRDELLAKDDEAAQKTLNQMQRHVDAARGAATDPLWKAAGTLPVIGPNFSVATELVLSADDVVDRAAEPMLRVFNSLEWKAMTPVDGRFDVGPLESAAPSVAAAANTIELTHSRLSGIDDSGLLPEVSRPLGEAKDVLNELRLTLNIAADTSKILPAMMGADGPRNYLLLIQNSAEVRATGGLPGALAVLHLEDGTIRLDTQSSGAAMGRFTPAVDVDSLQTQIFSRRLGTFISDVNLTPDFPTAARTAKSMWEVRHGTAVDGVIAVDPVVLSHILEASGPLPAPDLGPGITSSLPSTLTADNVLKTLLSDVYSTFDSNEHQDAYFALTSEEIFSALASGKVPADRLIKALATSTEENRLRIWSGHKEEQGVLADTGIGGSISGPNVGGASFGIYFNDGTGAKMDYYMRRSVQLLEECTTEGYSEVKVRVTTTNTAPLDAATALPASVTGGGLHGVPAGTVQTNIVVYGPAHAQIETVHQDEAKIPFGSYIHSGRPVGTVTTRLAPGERSIVDFSFGKIVQSGEPSAVVTPMLQSAKDVVLKNQTKQCAASTKTAG